MWNKIKTNTQTTPFERKRDQTGRTKWHSQIKEKTRWGPKRKSSCALLNKWLNTTRTNQMKREWIGQKSFAWQWMTNCDILLSFFRLWHAAREMRRTWWAKEGTSRKTRIETTNSSFSETQQVTREEFVQHTHNKNKKKYPHRSLILRCGCFYPNKIHRTRWVKIAQSFGCKQCYWLVEGLILVNWGVDVYLLQSIKQSRARTL